ncbi:uncharacterized protein LOC129574873 [Sitodiplosis mosellana]|uniref:uncharacterized protein LOC129574873 n=1 Tax=Sitodiplosis mosellana TaxID=263140 RepID=UPI002444F4DC|nr:uncharacterized protein LOC129574873 [Sitodiplosis mosellana]
MAPKRKRMKLEEAAAQELEDVPVEYKETPEVPKRKQKVFLETLNDDCIYTILGKLSLSNLCAVSKTCRRLHTLASNQFMRCHKSKVMTIKDVTENGDLVVPQKEEEYIRCFAKSMENVTFGRLLAKKATLREVNKAYHFKKTDTMAPIKILRIDNWARGLRMSHRPALAKLVNGVESITVSNTKVYGDLNACLLQHIPDMKRLTLCQQFEEKPGDATINWMQQIYPKLEYFAWHANSELPVAEAKQLLKLNPNISFFSLYTKSRNTLRRLMDEQIHINELYVDVMRTDIPAIFNDLHDLCEQRFCDRLHLKFSDFTRHTLTNKMDQLILLGPYIEGLYFEKIGIDGNFARTINTFDQLKVLQLNIAVNASLLSKALSLQEIFAYWGVNSQNFKSYQEAMLMYAANTPTLKKIYLRNNSQLFDRFNFDVLNLVRQKLDGARKLKIYFKSEECEFTGKLNDVNCDFDMVEVMRVETEHVANPLITEYLTTRQLSTENNSYMQYKYGRY